MDLMNRMDAIFHNLYLVERERNVCAYEVEFNAFIIDSIFHYGRNFSLLILIKNETLNDFSDVKI